MAQHYSNPKRANDPHALPDLDVFHINRDTAQDYRDLLLMWMSEAPDTLPSDYYGWYWQACFPGYLPDSDPFGPFATEADALADAREGVDDGEDE